MRNQGSARGDNGDMDGRRIWLDDRRVEALLRGSVADPALLDALADLRALGQSPPPNPSMALAAVLEHGFVPPVPVPARRPRVATRAGVVLGVLALALPSAAAANALPRAVQGPTAAVLSSITPFHFPSPAPPTPPARKPAPAVLIGPGSAPGPSGPGSAEFRPAAGEPSEKPRGQQTQGTDDGDAVRGRGGEGSQGKGLRPETSGQAPSGGEVSGSDQATDERSATPPANPPTHFSTTGPSPTGSEGADPSSPTNPGPENTSDTASTHASQSIEGG